VRDRRFYPKRIALVHRVLDEVFSQRSFTVRASDCARLFGVAAPVCDRILAELEAAGVVQQARPGIWMRRAAT
jgi:ribosomal protein S25